MKTQKPSLGWALAHLQTEKKVAVAEFSEADKDYLDKILNRYDSMKNNGSLNKALEALPTHTCSFSHLFLQNNEDFFIALFSNTKHDEACIRLYKHMNDCYPCFEVFSQVLRDYYHCGEELTGFFGEKQHG